MYRLPPRPPPGKVCTIFRPVFSSVFWDDNACIYLKSLLMSLGGGCFPHIRNWLGCSFRTFFVPALPHHTLLSSNSMVEKRGTGANNAYWTVRRWYPCKSDVRWGIGSQAALCRIMAWEHLLLGKGVWECRTHCNGPFVVWKVMCTDCRTTPFAAEATTPRVPVATAVN